jgi:hypothetical protein
MSSKYPFFYPFVLDLLLIYSFHPFALPLTLLLLILFLFHYVVLLLYSLLSLPLALFLFSSPLLFSLINTRIHGIYETEFGADLTMWMRGNLDANRKRSFSVTIDFFTYLNWQLTCAYQCSCH